MCDYSLHNVKSRPAKVGDKLTTRKFYSGTTGFSAPEDTSMAVCVLPGTELSFTDEVRRVGLWPWSNRAGEIVASAPAASAVLGAQRTAVDGTARL